MFNAGLNAVHPKARFSQWRYWCDRDTDGVYYILPVYCQLSHGVLGEVLLPHGLQTTLICARRWARLRVAGQGLD